MAQTHYLAADLRRLSGMPSRRRLWSSLTDSSMSASRSVNNNNNNNNNKRICIAQVCRMTSEALGGQLQSCYTARARFKCLTEEKCFKTTLEQS